MIGLVAAAAGLAVALGLIFTGGSKDSSLKALPSGPPKAMRVEGALETKDLATLIKLEPFIFEGTVTEIGGSEPVATHGTFVLTRHRVRMDVGKTYRGQLASTVDVSMLDVPEAMDTFEVGQTYIVFAKYRHLGDMTAPSLVPEGYSAGAYAVKGNEAEAAFGRRIPDVAALATQISGN